MTHRSPLAVAGIDTPGIRNERSRPFGARLDAALSARGSLCVGIDPHAALLRDWGLTDDVNGLARFSAACVEAFAAEAAVVKPQSAFFERFGAAGIAVLERTVADCRAAGALVVLDVKRGDIGSTMAAYAQAYLDPSSPLAADAMTVSPFLGVGSLEPAFDAAAEHGAGLFVLALTSNPEGPQFQHARTAAGVSVAQTVVDELAERNRDRARWDVSASSSGPRSGSSVAELAQLNGPYLVPGIGAQGGTSDDVRRIFGAGLANVVPSVSREVLAPARTCLRCVKRSVRVSDQFAFLRP